MTVSTWRRPSEIGEVSVERSVRIYRGLTVLYPRSFRQELGDDLVQAFRDLLVLSGDVRGTWWRAVRDLAASVPKERANALRGGGEPGGRNAAVAVVVVVLGLAVLGIVGGGPGSLIALVMVAALGLLPGLAIASFRRAWVARRTTGRGALRPALIGVGALVPAAVMVVVSGPDRVYWIGATVFLGLIGLSALGVAVGVATLLGRRGSGSRSHRRRAVVGMVLGAAVLVAFAAGSYNSYRQSLGPPGDHSVANASAESRSLWEAARVGDVEAVARLSTTCADPWVKFPVGNGRHNAKGMAEQRILELPDSQEAPYERIREILRGTMDTWFDRCGG